MHNQFNNSVIKDTNVNMHEITEIIPFQHSFSMHEYDETQCSFQTFTAILQYQKSYLLFD